MAEQLFLTTSHSDIFIVVQSILHANHTTLDTKSALLGLHD
jgi:hypothetical protein